MKKSSEKSFCNMPQVRRKVSAGSRSAFYEHRGNLCWKGVRNQPYKTAGDDWSQVVRRVLIGDHGEKTRFHLRYFEISPGGRSSLERHSHEHVIICVRGRGMVRYSRRTREMGYLDLLYVSPHAVHQLSNPFKEPFGFFCIVNAKRDRPRKVRPSTACHDKIK